MISRSSAQIRCEAAGREARAVVLLAKTQAASMLESAEARCCVQLRAALGLAAYRQVRADARVALLRWQQLARQRQLAGEHAALREAARCPAIPLE
eukprot:SAG11_NODE_4136_length_2044_cov_1.715681_1_plen_95_part_10